MEEEVEIGGEWHTIAAMCSYYEGGDEKFRGNRPTLVLK
jgi:hypothetical protein